MNPKRMRWILFCVISAVVLVGCGSPGVAITPVITAPAETAAPDFRPSGDALTASGVVVPAQQANLGLALPARVGSIEVEEGDFVYQGQVLIQLTGRDGLEAAVAAAELELLAAQQAADLALGQAKLAWANALDALDEAKREWTANQPGNRASPTALKDARADVTIAEKRLSQAQAALDQTSGTMAKAQAQNALTEARSAYYQAVWRLNWLQSEPTELEQARLDANLAYAEEALKVAESELARLEDESSAEGLALAEARLIAAEKGLAAAQSALAESQISAPFSGVVVSITVNPGEAALPGQVLLTLADLEHLQVETTDLSERDVDLIEVGQQATVYLEAIGEEVEGEVVEISLQSQTIGGDVVYPVTIDLPQHPENLRWGMSVEVEIRRD